MTPPLVQAIRRRLAELADPAKAGPMQAYMKSALPFRGVSGPAQKAVLRALFAEYPLTSRAAWSAAVLALWRDARYREEWYAAIALLSHRRYRAYRDARLLPLLAELIVTGAWWDVVDAVATHPLGDVLRHETAQGRGAGMRRRLLGWARGRNVWKRRAAMLSQIGFGGETDREFLYACIAPSLLDVGGVPRDDIRHDFFIRKAIGWALRQYARVDAGEVRRFVTAHAAQLSPLSIREALKHDPAGLAALAASPRARGKDAPRHGRRR